MTTENEGKITINDVYNTIESFENILGTSETIKVLDKFTADHEKFLKKKLVSILEDNLPSYFIAATTHVASFGALLVDHISEIRKKTNDDEIFKGALRNAFENASYRVFLSPNGIKVYDTLIKKCGMRRSYRIECNACKSMIDNYTNLNRNEDDKNDYLSRIKALLDYGMPTEYCSDIGLRKQSLLAYTLIKEAAENMPYLNALSTTNLTDNERKNTEEQIRKQWALLNLLGDGKYKHDWSFTFPTYPIIPDFNNIFKIINREDCQEEVKRKNLLTGLINPVFFNVSLKPILEWIINKATEQGCDLLNKTTDEYAYNHVFQAINRLKRRYESARKDPDEEIFSVPVGRDDEYDKARLTMLDEIYESFSKKVTNPRILEYITLRKEKVQQQVQQPQAKQTNEPQQPVPCAKKGFFGDAAETVRDFFKGGPQIKS